MDRGTPREAVEGQDVRRLEATVVGRVQGVGFRWFVCDQAAALGLIGWVRNAADGSVEVVAQGHQGALAALETALRRGPAGAAVRAVHTTWSRPVELPPRFQMRGADHGGD
jgi:acylphosphatase